MKRTEKQSDKTTKPQVKKKITPKADKQVVEKMEDVKRLVHLLQVHQIELEHQNQELRIAQEELEASRNKYVALFDFSPIPYFTLGVDGVIKEVNLSASKMFGIDRNKLIGKHFVAFIPIEEKDIFNSFIKTVFNSPGKNTCELKVMNKDKSRFHVLLEGLEIEDALEQDKKCQVALIDLTEYKRIEDSFKKSNEELKILNTTKDKFFSIIAHDLKSPFQSLLGSSEILATEIESLSQEEIIRFSRQLNDNLKIFYVLLENLLYWSMMQRGMIEYNPIRLNLFDLVKKIVRISNQSAVKKNILIVNSIDAGIVVYADADMLRSVVLNLLVNAIKFTSTEGQIVISSTEKNGFVEVSIQDTGVGIESGKSSQLFDFSKLISTQGTAGEKGTGLGLPLCKEFVEKQGGKIWVESELGKGSKFIFTLRKKYS
ncbi:MAG: PAS domain-containing sensor histidine kinase [Ignavibacteriaceae bacterium]|nr:PAS domain-containing sensor histidine kinase [Ignavibacteriaceae bacterium]